MAQGPIGWNVEFKVNPGKIEAFKEAAARTAKLVKDTEPGTLMYQWYLDEKAGVCYIKEWFNGQDAAIAHATGQAVQKELPALMQLGEFKRIDVYGTPNEQLAKVLEAFPVTSRTPHLTGFSR